ncbi:bifunctional serine/threonine protein kinase/MFS transporter [Stieleria sp. JC731]|uniref:serine/threonine protein kinase n=1 Tax=Pirellulaceae TaxID=2691357 RepID=UPI001E397CC9|nr:serine/threonine-protein kinase [Stieleria sp. JC731]MCC9600469.1 bifunctional serine/threonine protein kinase/MFS transporter [Stieleria sp. JC731]
MPKCKKCRAPFVVHISADDPPKVRVGIPKKPRADKQNAPNLPAPASNDHIHSDPNLTRPVIDPERTRSGSEETIDQTIAASDEQTGSVKAGLGKATDLSISSSSTRGRSSAKPSSGTQSSKPSSPADPQDSEPSEIPSRLGGYRLIRMLGRGAMGAVYQAKQISLDRDVALKTIRARFASSPASLARFTREAYAAAQLTHHNVVQIYDFGEDNGLHYFSMEWIRGGSLADLVRQKGSISPKLAATYILQAARGLQFAHRNGMVHRDVKPANLLLAEDGVVKVADLGLVKIPDQVDPEPIAEEHLLSGLQSGTQVTMQGTAVGTPAYMAPEQSADSSTVDHRADIYSLGCSLFFLLTGRSPYSGDEPIDVLEMHAKSPVPDLAEANPRAPHELADIISRSMAKRPTERYASLAEMIDDLQSFLGLDVTVGFSPTNEQADRWETLAANYAKTQRFNRFGEPLLIAFAVAMAFATIGITASSLSMALLAPVLFVSTCISAVTFGALGGSSVIAKQVRAWFETLSLFETIVFGIASLALTFVTVVTGLWIGAIAGLVLGIGLGAAYHFAIVTTSEKSGQEALNQAKHFVRDLRIDGVEENGLRDFIARYAGDRWQLVFEALFGYDAMVSMRSRLASDNSYSGSTAGNSIRDRIYKKLAVKAKAKREAKDQQKLANLERESLISQGVSVRDAQEQAWQVAAAVMEGVQKVVDSTNGDERVQAEAKRQRIKAMLADARSGKYKRQRDRHASWKLALSGYTRMLVGCLMLTIFAFALQATGVINDEVIATARRGDLTLQNMPNAETGVLGVTVSVWSIGIAGILLCMSAFVSGWRMSPFALVATLTILFGPRMGIPDVGLIQAWMIAAAAGMAVYIPGAIYGEEPEPELWI